MKQGLPREEGVNLFKKGVRRQFPEFTLIYRKKKQKKHRFAVVVPKKVIRLSVQRNKLKKQVRDIVRNMETRIDFILLYHKKPKNFSKIKEDIFSAIDTINDIL